MYSKKFKPTYERYTCKNVYSNKIHSRKLCNHSRYLPKDEWIKKIWYICIHTHTHTHTDTHNGVLSSYEEEQNYVVYKKMDRTGSHPVKWNMTDWERQISHLLSHMWNLHLKEETNGMNV
jgi:hypothetical protein